MKFTDLDVNGFGIWSGLALEAISPQLTVLCGANEAGKTTILECLRGVLYGFAPARRNRYLPPVQGGQAGATLRVRVEGQPYAIARLDDGSRLLGGVTVTGPDGATQGESQLADLLDGIDEMIYSNVFAVGLRELQELATLNDTEAAVWLYDLSTGLDRVSIADVLGELRASRTRLLSAIAGKSQIIELVDKRDVLRAEIDELAGLADRYWRLADEGDAGDAATGAAEASLADLAADIQMVDAALAVREPWRERALVDEKVTTYRNAARLPADSLQRSERITADLRKLRRRRTQIRRRRQVLRDQRQGIKVNEAFWRQAARIAALSEHEPWIVSLDDQLRAGDHKVAEHERQLTAARAQCGLSEDTPAASEMLSRRSMAALRGPAIQLRDARRRLKTARQDCRKLQAERDARSDELASALAGRREQTLSAALDNQGQLVAQYRRRLLLDDRLDQMALHRQELEDKQRDLVDRQVLPLWLLISIAAVFVLGAGLVLAGFIIPWGVGPAIVGGVIAAAAAGGKVALERSLAHRLSATKKQLQMLKGQFEQSKAERGELDRQLPQGGGSLASRLQAAEAELASLEELLSIDARRQAVDAEAGAAKQRLKAAAEESNRARRRWQQALAEFGLPADLSPPQVKQMIAHSGSLESLERQLEHARGERDRCRREQSAVAARIEQLNADAGWQASPGAPPLPLVDQLRRLRRELVAQEEMVNRRSDLDLQLDRLRRLWMKYSRRRRVFLRQRRELFAAAGALDETDFRHRALERAELDELLRQRDSLARQIQAALEGRASEKEIAALLTQPPGQLERQRDDLVARHRAAADDIKRLACERGRIAHEQTLLADDRRLAQKQLDLGMVEERLSEATARWRTLATAERLIESVKEEYERNRQPEVLQEASQYLERMTDGRYARVWTPLSENMLRVDDEQGRSLPIELLSTGAREQLFLALRLALVSRYTRHGKQMPLVLDDVLVNFDARRAAAAAAMFANFAAAGHQLILFTCHEHIAELFRALRADVRRLPGNADAARKIVSPEPPDQEIAAEPPRRRREKRPKEPPSDDKAPVQAGTISISTHELKPSFDPRPIEVLAMSPALEILSDEEPPPEAALAEPTPRPAATPAPKSARRHRADPRHRLAPMKTARRSRWSAEEFEGELEDQVNTAFEAAVSADAGDHTIAESPSTNGDA